MLAAEKAYEGYRESRRYESVSRVPITKKQTVQKKNPNRAITVKEKTAILMLTALVGLLCIGLILTTAYAAKVKYNINSLSNENAIITGEIEALNVEKQTGTNLQTIERRASMELGMIYPSSNQFVFLNGSAKPNNNFAMAMKEKAYN